MTTAPTDSESTMDTDAVGIRSSALFALDCIHCGDNVQILSGLPSDSIDLVVTSPPYDDLRTYGGHTWDFEGLAKELTRVMKPGGVIVWVVADATINGSETLTSMRQAIYFKDVCGLNVHDTMVYQVAGTGAKGSTLAYWQEWEYCFVLSKGRPRHFEPIGNGKKTKNGGERLRVNGERKPTREREENEGRPGNVWRYAVGQDPTGHPAPFPLKLAKDHVASWSKPGDIVLDPFAGSGTTLRAAKDFNRRFIGIEINPAYVEICHKRLAQDVLPLFEANKDSATNSP